MRNRSKLTSPPTFTRLNDPMKSGEIYYTTSGNPILCRIIGILPNGREDNIVFDRYPFSDLPIMESRSIVVPAFVSASYIFEEEMKLLSESGQMGKWPIGSLISHRGNPYEVLGYFRRFIAVKELDSNRLAIIRRYHKTNHRHIMI